MIKRGVIFFVLSIFLVLASGCETVKGTWGGMKKDFRTAKNWDEWLRENLW